jgi:tRNA(Ile)-lysidine synthase
VHKFVRQLITEWRRLSLPVEGPVIVAVSGGADSSALLAALAELRERKKLAFDIVAAHFNHKLRGRESDADEVFVRQLAEGFGARFVAGAGKLAGTSDLEQRARKARYAFLERIARQQDAPVILTAHTLNDQAETFLMNLVRGSGPAGLTAMPAVRPLSADRSKANIRDPRAEIDLVRPLLGWATRSDTESFCNQNGVKYRRDSMNDDLRFTRVRIRKEIIPKLTELNPRIVQTLARTAALLAGSETARSPVLPRGSAPDAVPAEPLEVQPATLRIKELVRLDPPVLKASLREWLRWQRGDLRGVTLKHVAAIENLVNSSKSGRVAELPGPGRVVKSGGILRFEEG